MQPSIQLIQVLRTYCDRLEPDSMADLRLSIQRGRYPWLRDELAAAVGNTDLGDDWWSHAIGDHVSAEPGTAERQDCLQDRLWRALFPTEPPPQRP
ncbi:hypothetical protein ACFQZ4_37010 [Catellatospora coxensis]|uniref:Uncharacterized protein n=1 Tax=Catellatospora coxensis TaxID=310354 RepID=A0A8J3P6T0_9ACTN|nr:hypothetical protein [Catellatospora coxensis]GIG03806.1 hypothetical protein Cco03nite_05060 [Catellatospora coxensis]